MSTSFSTVSQVLLYIQDKIKSSFTKIYKNEDFLYSSTLLTLAGSLSGGVVLLPDVLDLLPDFLDSLLDFSSSELLPCFDLAPSPGYT